MMKCMFPLRMKDNDILVTKLYKVAGYDDVDYDDDNDYINDDTLTIICEMTIPGNDKTT